jgi:hypothetical protein
MKDKNEWFNEQMWGAWMISDLGEVCFTIGILIEWDHPNCSVVVTNYIN